MAIKGDATPLYSFFTQAPVLPPVPNLYGDLARQAVSCADSYVSGCSTAEDLAKTTLDVLKNVTPRFALR